MKYFEIKVAGLKKEEKLYTFLKQNGFSEHYLKQLRNTKDVIKVNDKTENINVILKNDDIIQIASNPIKATEIELINKPLDIVYEDDYFLLVNKPPMLATMPSRSHYKDNLAGMVCNYMKDKDENYTLRVFNRLDREACGMILISKNAVVHQKVKDIEKEYYAICHGTIKKKITVKEPILTVVNNGINEMKRVCSPLGQSAETTFIPIKNFNNKTLLKVKIFKGRTHQIRLHASHISHPLIGDKLYGIPDDFSHTYLCLKKISFHFDITNQDYSFEINLPPEFEKVLKNS